jgi:hypothetical protein
VKDEPWSKSVQDQLHETVPPTGGLQSLEAHLDRYIARTYESLRKGGQSIVSTSRDFWIRWSRKRGASTLSKSIQDQLHEILPPTGGLQSLEAHLDRYIARTYENFRTCKPSIVNKSRDFWIRWSRKRGASIRDTRSQAILVKLLDKEEERTEQLSNLQRYLEAYIAGSFGRALETLSEVVSRLRAIFGIGWFFEWPSGRHPLNSTWPWADVKPSLLVLWGVCWMFYPTDYGNPYDPGHFRFPLQQNQSNNRNYVQYGRE